MDMAIEVLIFLAIFFTIFVGLIILFVHKQIKIRRYKPENDKSRRAEEGRRRIDVPGPVLPTTFKRPNLLPTASADFIGEVKSSVGKTSNGYGDYRNPFKKR